MLHILLTLLKIIGIIILSIIGLIILIIACILFAPVRYNISLSLHDKFKSDIKVSYLFHGIYFRHVHSKENKMYLRILGYKTHFFNSEESRKIKELDKETEMFEKMSQEINDTKVEEELPPKIEKLQKIDELRDKIVDDTEENNEEKEFEEKNSYENDSKTGNSENKFTETEEIDDEEIGFISRIINIIRKFCFSIKSKIIKIKCKIVKIYDKIKQIKNKLQAFKAFIQDENNKEVFRIVKKEIFNLLNHMKPRKVKGYVHFGFTDPSYTGKTLGILSMFYGKIPRKLSLQPDFEETVLEGDIVIKGRIYVIYVLIIAFRLYKNDKLKSILKNIKK